MLSPGCSVTQHVGTEWWRPTARSHGGSAETAAATAQASPVPFSALLLFTFIMLLAPQTFVPGLARMRIALLTGAFAMVAHCWTQFAAGRPLMRLTRETWLAVALLAWVVVTIPLSEWPGGSLRILLDFYVKALIIFWLLCSTVNTLGRLRTVAWWLSLMAVPLAITALRNFTLQGAVGRITGYDAPLTANPNDLALMLNLILPLTVALFLVSRRPAMRGLLAGLILLDAGAVVATFSRAGFVTLATSLVLYLRTLRRWGGWRWTVLALGLGVASISFLPSAYLERIGTIADISTDPTGSAQERWQDTRVALRFVLDHPLVGAGMGMNILALNDLRGAAWRSVHNVYLEYAVDLGWPGLGLFLLLLTSSIRGAARVHERCASVPALREVSALADAIRITLVAFAVAALFHPIAYHFYFYYFAALAVAVGTVCEVEARTAATSLPPR